VWKQLFKSNWKGFTGDIEQLKSKLQRHRQLIENKASLIDFQQTQTLLASMERIFCEQRDLDTKRKKVAVSQWLSSAGYEVIHEQHVKVRSSNPTSCRWILGDDRFQKWFDPIYCSTPLLWINGKPGAGEFNVAILGRTSAQF
jgi:hypothetical protein